MILNVRNWRIQLNSLCLVYTYISSGPVPFLDSSAAKLNEKNSRDHTRSSACILLIRRHWFEYVTRQNFSWFHKLFRARSRMAHFCKWRPLKNFNFWCFFYFSWNTFNHFFTITYVRVSSCIADVKANTIERKKLLKMIMSGYQSVFFTISANTRLAKRRRIVSYEDIMLCMQTQKRNYNDSEW